MIRTLSLALLIIAAPAHAQTQAEMNVEAGADVRRADAALNAQYRVTRTAMQRRDAADTTRGGGFGYASALLQSQRAWLNFRDRQCVIEGGEFAGGSMQALAITNCRTRLTRERTEQLRALEWRR